MMDERSVRNRLTAERDRVQRLIAGVQGDERRETAEGQTDTAHLWEDADIRDADLDQLSGELSDIDAAIQRLDAGSYGTCASCGQPIPDGRLEVMPYAMACVECAET